MPAHPYVSARSAKGFSRPATLRPAARRRIIDLRPDLPPLQRYTCNCLVLHAQPDGALVRVYVGFSAVARSEDAARRFIMAQLPEGSSVHRPNNARVVDPDVPYTLPIATGTVGVIEQPLQ